MSHPGRMQERMRGLNMLDLKRRCRGWAERLPLRSKDTGACA